MIRTLRPRRARRGALLACAGLAAVAVLSGCSTSASALPAGQAAAVGQQTLPVSTVLEQTREVTTASADLNQPPPPTAQVNTAQVATWVEGRLTRLAADAVGVSVTDGQVDAFLDDFAEQNGLTRSALEQQFAAQPGLWVPPSVLDSFAETFLLQRAIGEKLAPQGTSEQRQRLVAAELSKASQADEVVVAPRFGSWDQAGSRVVGSPNDLSAPPRLVEPQLTPLPTEPPAQG